MNIFPDFPDQLTHDPAHQTEFLVYQELANSPVGGQGLYKVRTGTCPAMDLVIWIEGVGCFCIKVHEGPLLNQDGGWSLPTADGTTPISNVISQTWRGAMGIRSAVRKLLGRKVFVLAAIVLPDDAPDPRTQAEVNGDSRVSVLWGERDLINRLVALPRVDDVFDPPTSGQIAAEVSAVKHLAGAVDHGTPAPHHPGASPKEPTMDFTVRQVVIQRADIVNVYTTSSEGEPEAAED